jgi:hypothetical protein
MRLTKLIQLLQEAEESTGGDVEVCLMIQPTYPLANHIAGVALGEEFASGDREYPNDAVFILEGEQIGYGERDAWDAKL